MLHRRFGVPVGAVVAMVLAWTVGWMSDVSADSFEISGGVFDQTGTGIQGATVETRLPGTSTVVTSTATGPGGAYSVEVAGGTYDVRVVPGGASGLQAVTISNQVVQADRVLDIILIPAGPITVSGRVLNGSGVGVAGQNVYLTPAGAPGLLRVTGVGGTYSFEVGAGMYQVGVQGGNNLASTGLPRDYSIQTGYGVIEVTEAMVLDLQLPAQEMQVRVLKPDGSPAANVNVFTNAPTNAQVLGGYAGTGYAYYNNNRVYTDDDGYVTMYLFPTPGTSKYSLTAFPAAGSGAAMTTNEGVDVTTSGEIVINLLPSFTVSGRVLNGSGVGVAGQNVYLTPAGAPGLLRVTGVGGTYSFEVGAGMYQVGVQGGNNLASTGLPRDYSIQTGYGVIEVTEAMVLDLQLPAQEMQVRVLKPDGSPAANVNVFTNAPTNAQVLGGYAGTGYAYYNNNRVYTDDDGYVTMYLFPTPGTSKYSLTAFPAAGSGAAMTTNEGVDVTTSGEIVINLLPSFTVSGRVLNGSGVGVAGQNVYLTPAGAPGLLRVTGVGGTYSFEVGAGMYQVGVQGGNNLASTGLPRDYSIQTGYGVIEVTEAMVLDLQLPAQEMQVRVLKPDGSPAANVNVFTNAPTNAQVLGGYAGTGYAYYNNNRVYTDDDGYVTMYLFPTPGVPKYSLTAVPPAGTFLATVTAQNINVVSDGTLVIALQSTDIVPPSVTVQATTADGAPYHAGTWARLPVTVSFNCSDSGSGVAQCPTAQTYSADGIGSATGIATDNAGNVREANFGPIMIDSVAPTITLAPTAGGNPYAAGTSSEQPVSIAVTCIDATSGVTSCPATTVYDEPGTFTFSASVADAAGNVTTMTFSPVVIVPAGPFVRLVDHSGIGLETGTVSAYYSGAWHVVPGTTDTTGRLSIAGVPQSSNLSIAVTYNGTRLQKNYAELTSSGFTFQTRLVSMELRNHSGDPMDTGAGSYFAGSWRTAGTTEGGSTQVEMLPGTYSFAMVYNGTRLQVQQNIASDPVVVFAARLVTLRLQNSNSQLIDSGDGSYYAGSWRTLGSTQSGVIEVEMLPGTYAFAMTYLGSRLQISQDIATNPVVVFATTAIHSVSGSATSYYAGAWRPFLQDMELLPGTYTFKFSGHPNTSYVISPGVTNSIH